MPIPFVNVLAARQDFLFLCVFHEFLRIMSVPPVHPPTFHILSRHLSASCVPGTILDATDLTMCEHNPFLRRLGLGGHTPAKMGPRGWEGRLWRGSGGPTGESGVPRYCLISVCRERIRKMTLWPCQQWCFHMVPFSAMTTVPCLFPPKNFYGLYNF